MTSRRRRDERGSATIDMAIWLPVLFGVVFLTMQAGLYHYGRSAALAIATAGARAGAVEHGTNTTCQQAAHALLAKAGDALAGVAIACDRGPTTVTVTVTGTTLSVIPLVVPATTQTVTLPVERLTR